MQPAGNKDQSRENSNQKVHPQPTEENMKDGQDSMESLVSKVFKNISSLKAAYIQIQGAHTPYDADKIQAADKVVVEELVTLSELKHSYRDKYPKPLPTSPKDARLALEIQDQQNLLKTYEVMVKKFQLQIQNTDSEILRLQQQIQDSRQKKVKLEKKLRQRDMLSEMSDKAKDSSVSVELTPSLFSSAVDEAQKAVSEFSKALINMMKAAGWDLGAAANSIEPSVSYSKKTHMKYAFTSHICKRIFGGFQEENFLIEPSTQTIFNNNFFHHFVAIRSMDPLETLSKDPDSEFGKFCRCKYLLIMHPKMESSLFGNLDQRNYVANGGHPRTPFYLSFLKMAKSVWLLHRLAYSFDPEVKIFQVKVGSEFSELYMQSTVKDMVFHEGNHKPKVGLMVMPGFMIGSSVIQSQVYLSGHMCH